MPRRRYRNRRRPPRRYRRYGRKRMGRRRNMAHTLTVRQPTTVPDRIFVKLKYSSTQARSPALTYDNWVFRGNSCYDPDQTGAGHQPFGYDQWCSATTFYTKYRVHSSKVTVKFINFLSDATYFALYPTLSTSAPSSLDNAQEIPYGQIRLAGPKGAGNDIVVMKGHMFTKRMYGVKTIVPEDNFAAAYNGDPASPWYWMLYAQSGSGSNVIYTFIIKVTYYVEFFYRTQIGQS